MIQVLLVDDHPLVRKGIAAVLSDEPDIEIVGSVGTASEAFAVLEQVTPDVVVVDVRLPDMDGIDACSSMLETDSRLRIIVLTRFENESIMMRAFTAGVRGFLVKESDPSLLRHAVRTVANGTNYVDPKVTRKLVSLATKGRRARGPYGLTLQEMRVVEMLPKGLSNREIAVELGVSPHTVKTHLRHAMRKLRAADRTEAAAIVMREGLA